MSRPYRNSLLLFLAGSIFFVGLSVHWLRVVPPRMPDFKALYYGARSALEHGDPYQPSEVFHLYKAEGGELPSNPQAVEFLRQVVSVDVNLPTTLFLVAPLAALPWKLAAAIWGTLAAGSYLLACFLVWRAGVEHSPRLAGILIFLLLAGSESLLVSGNSAGLVIPLTAIAARCFLRNRFVWAGIVCLAVALVLKPHDAGFVWLYFALAGTVQRKRALLSLLLVAMLTVPTLLWISHVSPNWAQELHANLAAGAAHGGLNDPGPRSEGARGGVISLQGALSYLRNDPRFYNPAAYIICAPLLILWGIRTVRRGPSAAEAWLALAVVAAL